MQTPRVNIRRRTLLTACAAIVLGQPLAAQSQHPFADLGWREPETPGGRFLIAPGERAMVSGYARPGLEIWAYPLQLLRGYYVTFRVDGDTTEIDGRSAIRSVEHTPTTATRTYAGHGVIVRELITPAADVAAATIAYVVDAGRPVTITVHFTPSLNLMWPAAVGGQEIRWDSTHMAYAMDEPTHRFRGAILSRDIVRHDPVQSATRDGEFERILSFTLRALAVDGDEVKIAFAGASTPDQQPLSIASALASGMRSHEARARARYDTLHRLEIDTPDSSVNRALRWAQVTLEQAWVCNPQLGCGLVAGYGPSRGARRPQYAWFFAGDGLVAVDALLREGAYDRARAELEFILRYQDKRTGAIWHELSQSAGFLDWAGAYPYMFVHVDVSFDFLNGVRDYVRTTGDVAFAKQQWDAIRLAFDYCRSTVSAGSVLPSIPPGQQGRDEQDPQRDELALSLAWVDAAESFAALARLTNHADLAEAASKASALARAAIRSNYFDARRRTWASGHLRSGAAVEGMTGSATALLQHGILNAAESSALVDALARPAYRTAWGIRSTPSDSPVYDPDAYARGSVWAIGTADAVMAFYEAGRPHLATAVWRDLVPWFSLDAPGHMHEVLAGNRFAPERESVPDQTWSSASFLSSAVRGLLGLDVDGLSRHLRFAPRLPLEWDAVRVRHLNLGGTDVGIALHRSRDTIEIDIVNAGPPFTLLLRPELPAGAHIRSAQVRDDSRVRGTPLAVRSDELTTECRAAGTTHVTLRLTRSHR